MNDKGSESDMVDALFAAVDRTDERSVDERVAKLEELIGMGVDVNVPGDYGLRALHKAVSSSRKGPLPELPIIEKLIALGAEVNMLSDSQVLPIHTAIASNDTDPDEVIDAAVEVVELLHAHGGRSGGYRHLSHNSCCAPRMLACLLDVVGGDTEDTDEEGNTPLHLAVGSQRPALVELLIERGANLAAVNNEGLTPLGKAQRGDEYSQAQKDNKSGITDLLDKAGAPSEAELVASENCTPLPVVELKERALSETNLSASAKKLFQQDLVTGQLLAKELKDKLGYFEDSVGVVHFLRKVLGDGEQRKLSGDQSMSSAFFHMGDLEVTGHLGIVAPFVVTGNLVVQGCISDCGPDSFVVVQGNVECEGLDTSGEFHVGGDIHARQAVYGYYNDNVLYASTLRSMLVIEDDHSVVATVESPNHFDMDRFCQGRGEVQEELRALLVPEIFIEDEDGEESFSSSRLFERICAGEPVFRL